MYLFKFSFNITAIVTFFSHPFFPCSVAVMFVDVDLDESLYNKNKNYRENKKKVKNSSSKNTPKNYYLKLTKYQTEKLLLYRFWCYC